MPCTYIETEEEIAARRNKEKLAQEKPFKREIDKVTRMLCTVLTVLTDRKNITTDDVWHDLEVKYEDIINWWDDHQAKDNVAAAKKKRAKILAKLTPEEIKFLKLK